MMARVAFLEGGIVFLLHEGTYSHNRWAFTPLHPYKSKLGSLLGL